MRGKDDKAGLFGHEIREKWAFDRRLNAPLGA